jgi:hypothetical protein
LQVLDDAKLPRPSLTGANVLCNHARVRPRGPRLRWVLPCPFQQLLAVRRRGVRDGCRHAAHGTAAEQFPSCATTRKHAAGRLSSSRQGGTHGAHGCSHVDGCRLGEQQMLSLASQAQAREGPRRAKHCNISPRFCAGDRLQLQSLKGRARDGRKTCLE